MREVLDEGSAVSGGSMPRCPPGMEDFYALRLGGVWRSFRQEHFSFWMICAYLFVEYVRPQSIIPALDFLPWAQVFLILAVIGVFTDPSCRWVQSHITAWIFFFLVCVLVSTVGATYPDIAFERLPDIYLWTVIYLLIINIVNTRKRLFIFLSIFLLASFKISASLTLTWVFRGFSFTSWGLKGPPGFFENSGELAIQMAVYGPLAYAMALSIAPHVGTLKRNALKAMPLTAILVILGASSRGGQLALAAQAGHAFFKEIFKLRVILPLAVVLATSWALLPAEQKVRFTEMGSDKTSQQRLLYWQRGLEMLQEHPVSGVGFYNFPSYFARYYSEDLLVSHAQLPHNIFIQTGSELGYPGLIVYCLVILGAYRLGRRIRAAGLAGRDRDGGFAMNFGRFANVSLTGFVVAGQFVSVVYYPFLWIHLAMLVVMENILRNEARDEAHRAP